MTSRRSIEVEGFGHHGNPVVAASRVANVVMTGGISGQDPQTAVVPIDESMQIDFAFANLQRILIAAGASLEDVVKVDVVVKSPKLRETVNQHWVRLFPDPASRPARHLMQYDHFGGHTIIHLQAYAVIQNPS